MNKVHAKRLLKLATFLRKLPKKRFYYGSFTHKTVPGSLNEPLDLHTCGTTGCALGWAPSIPSFRKLGARMHLGIPTMKNVPSVTHGPEHVSNVLFGTTYGEFHFLFMPKIRLYNMDTRTHYGRTSPDDNASNKAVARHLERFVYENYPEMKP